ncbi:ATP-binding protein [Cocleimonas sp. KMM 6892]|uniref:sensor histidine kinase n=1 Tax=unclassified Cocleimonas TaxID=2639732 RepID=UPI002DBEE9EB|nr:MULTISPECIES: ATP-binding protein [unclassified Cocleimonas]MEB8431935.1 ATP-binding protein [Cocleimonas sp. KMM 6892]MEC4714979.1 ATP-binding protein [Cocleimonas sp. KMM 6895]MEC4744207.1 ATP-binding protein [Cocleimonas sp. KMM 6896]
MKQKNILILIGFFVLSALTASLHYWLKNAYQDQLINNQQIGVDTYRNALEAALARFDYLPHVLSQNNDLFELAFNQPELANKSLLAFKESSKVDAIYIMQRDGETIASSNWDQKDSFVGKNYGYRPYFKQALNQQKGQFFGVGATTNIPGYFVSAPYREKGNVKAVIVAKVLLSSIVDNWNTRTQDGETVFVADENNVIILTSKEDWLYNTLSPLNSEQNIAIKEQKQFGNNPLPLLDIKSNPQKPHFIRIRQQQYIQSIASPNVMNWKIHYLIPSSQISEKLFAFWSRVIILLLLGLAAILIIRGINNRTALRRSQGESSALRKLNLTLEREIEERKQIEHKLRKAQVELRRTSKLAAMGQLSASITHEIGQPLAAMRTYIANLTMDQQQATESNFDPSRSISTLSKLDQLVNRLTTITQQLRYFARSGDKETLSVDLRKAINGAITTTQPSIEEAGIRLDVLKGKDPVMVQAGRVRLEQVIVNLLKNSMEAILETSTTANAKNDQEWITLSLESTEKNAIIKIEDSGPGVSEEIRKELFEPFFTTKPSGVGMGLGLAISLNIIHELNGTLHVENRTTGGACFIITLPIQNSNDNEAIESLRDDRDNNDNE